MNFTARMPLSGSYSTLNELTASIYKNSYLATEFTGSSFQPYITHIHLYQKGDYDTPVMTANLVKPKRKSPSPASMRRETTPNPDCVSVYSIE